MLSFMKNERLPRQARDKQQRNFPAAANDGEPGLHICPGKDVAPAERVWIPVPPRAGSLVVNLGEQDLARNHIRISENSPLSLKCPCFHSPGRDLVLSCHGTPLPASASVLSNKLGVAVIN
jgi:hypothetical protein